MLTQSNKIYRTLCPTFPRSGHHWLVECLRGVFRFKLVYCEPYESEHTLDKCRFTNLQKTHDFPWETNLADREDTKYLVQIRSIPDCIISWYEEEIAHGRPDTEPSWREFHKYAMDHYLAFRRKWVYHPPKNAMVIEYESLCNSPAVTVANVCRHMWAGEPAELEVELDLRVPQMPKRLPTLRDVAQFKYAIPDDYAI